MKLKELKPCLHWGFETVEDHISYDDTGSYPAFLPYPELRRGYKGQGIVLSQCREDDYVRLGQGTFAKLMNGKSGFTVSLAIMANYRVQHPINLLTLYLDAEIPAFRLHRDTTGFRLYLRERRNSPEQCLKYAYVSSENGCLPLMRGCPMEYSGVWTQITISVDLSSNSVAFYANGQRLTADVEVSFSVPRQECGKPTVPDVLGGPSNASYYSFSGFVDELNFYDVALTAEDVAALYDPLDGDSSPARDQKRVEKLVARMGNSAAFYEGSGNVLYRGKIDKSDRTDYRKNVFCSDDMVMIPADFARRWVTDQMGEAPDSWKTVCYVSAEQLCDAVGGALCRFGKLTVISPPGEVGFSPNEDGRDLERMVAFYTEPWYPVEPSVPYEQTRTVVEKAGTQINDHVARFLCTPIIIRHKDALYVSLDLEGGARTTAEIYVSRDDGATWSHLSTVEGVFWANLFSHCGDLYLLGAKKVGDCRRATIVKSTDDGLTWTTPVDGYGYLAPQFWNAPRGGVHSAGMPILRKDGKIYKTFEQIEVVEGMGDVFYPFMMWADENADLLDNASWTFTEKFVFSPDDYRNMVPKLKPCKNITPLEGNAVIAPDGRIMNALRLTTGTSPNYGLLLALDEESRRLVPADLKGMYRKQFFYIPTGTDKFTIHYDPKNKCYISFVNNKTQSINYWSRNVLSMVVSKDLVHWEIIDTVLVDRTMMNFYCSMWKHGFQYVDWIVDDADLLLAVREAMDDSENFHDANYICVYRINNYAELIAKRLKENGKDW